MTRLILSFRFLLLPLLLLLLCSSDRTSAWIFAPQRFPLPPPASSVSEPLAAFPALPLSDFERAALATCPCADASQCLPLAFGGGSNAQLSAKKDKKEVYAFSVTTTDEWKRYDWEQLTTVAWNEDKELLCHAHSKGVKFDIKHNFEDVDALCDVRVRKQWIQTTYERMVSNFADGVNIDTEKPMHGAPAKCMTQLVRELRLELQQHTLTQHAQITFDVSWAPRGVDGRYYEWKQLADAADFLFVMSYDMRSQIYYQCIAAANSPLALVKQGLEEFLFGFGVAPAKLVLGVPWYGYKYACTPPAVAASADGRDAVCALEPSPFFGAPCSDAAGQQVDFRDIMALVDRDSLQLRWDAMTQTPVAASANGSFQIWFDNPESLARKYALVRELGLRGTGMWNVDSLDYAATQGPRARETQAMWAALQAMY